MYAGTLGGSTAGVTAACVAGAVASASTELAAFDRALVAVGAANYNLIRLSSVIPPGSSVAVVPRVPPRPAACWGDRLYTVYAEQRAASPGEQAWAGVGWVQDDRTGAGLFVEHEGGSERAVRDQISASLAELLPQHTMWGNFGWRGRPFWGKPLLVSELQLGGREQFFQHHGVERFRDLEQER